MSDNLIMAEGRGTTTPWLENLFIGNSPDYTPNLHRGYGDSLTKARPDAPLRIEPDRLYYGPGQRWRYIDSYGDRSFAGSFTGAEVDYIAAEFRDWPPRPIPPGVFGTVAERAIAAGRGGVA